MSGCSPSRLWLASLLLLTMFSPLAAAGPPKVRLELTDGSKLEGRLISYSDGTYEVGLGSAKVQIRDAEVAKVEFVSSAPPAPQAEPRPRPRPRPRAEPKPVPVPQPQAEPDARPRPAEAPRSEPAPLRPFKPARRVVPDAQGAYGLGKAFDYRPRVGDRLQVSRLVRTVSQEGEGREQESRREHSWVDTIETVDKDGRVVSRVRRYSAGKDEDGQELAGVAVRVRGRGPEARFERADGKPLGEGLERLLKKELGGAGRAALAAGDFVPEKPVRVGQTWSVDLSKSEIVSDLEAGGLSFDRELSAGQATLLDVGEDSVASLSVSLRLRPVALNGVELEGPAIVVASSTLWVHLAGEAPVARHEESGHLECQTGGVRYARRVSTVIETRLLRD